MVDLVKEPQQEWIDSQKKKWGKVWKVVLAGEAYVYRALRRSEYRELQKSVTPQITPNGPVVSTEQQSELEEKTAVLCVLWPEDFSKMDNIAGAASVLSTYISDSSGFVVEEQPVEL